MQRNCQFWFELRVKGWPVCRASAGERVRKAAGQQVDLEQQVEILRDHKHIQSSITESTLTCLLK